MEEHIVDAAGLHLSVRDWAGGEPPLLALHGLASNARWWDLVAARLAPAHRVAAIDLPGHGRSDRPDDGYGMVEVAAAVGAAVEALAIGPHVVVGHSWGASVALQHARRPDVVGVVCIDGGIADLRAVFGGSWEQAAPMMTPPAFSGITVEAMRGWAGISSLAEGSDVDTAAAILLGNFEETDGELRPRLSLDRHMRIARALFEADPAAMLAEVTCPVLVLPATEPAGQLPLRRQWAAAAQAALGDRLEVTWVDGGHDLPVQRPVEVAAAIDGWLSGVVAVGQPSTTS